MMHILGKKRFGALLLVCLLGNFPCALAAVNLDDGQLTTPIQTVVVGKSGDIEQVVFGQRAVKDRLVLVPDNCFFSGDGLQLSGSQPPRIANDTLNGDKSFQKIEGLQSSAQHVIWPLWIYATGKATVKVWCDATTPVGSKLAVKVGDQLRPLEAAAGTAQPFVAVAEFASLPTGREDLSLSLMADRGGFKSAVLRVEISGPAIHDALSLRARWRPAAVHSSFASSSLAKAGEPSRLWIMEVRPVPSEKSFYGPITTPFGYFGSTFSSDGTSGGINFSMWSFSAGKKAPPVSQLSHLLAVGDPQATFGEFSHEGTGVKLRGWNPYEGQRLSSGVLALRMDPGTVYDTYTGYFLDPQTRQWRFYASGRKWVGGSKAKRRESLLPGSFVEVPGPPNVERTGHIQRAADFRGWCRDSKGQWHRIDQMIGSNADIKHGETSSQWATTPDGWFRMSMGGMIHYRYAGRAEARLTSVDALPDYMAPERLKAIDRLPTEIAITKVTRQGSQVAIEFDLASSGKAQSTLKAFYGTADGLSLEKKWQHVKTVGEFAAGHHRIVLSDAPASGFCRLAAANDIGSYFTRESGNWK